MAPLAGSMIVLVMYVADHPRLHSSHRHQTLTLDRAITDERVLLARLGELLGADIQRAIVTQTDLVRDVTVVDVRYRLHGGKLPLVEQPEHDRLEPAPVPVPVAVPVAGSESSSLR